MTSILFVHQNYPGQFRYLAPALAACKNIKVKAMHMRTDLPLEMDGVGLHTCRAERISTPGVHPWIADLETKVIRAEAAFKSALVLSQTGYKPDVIIAHPGWGESLFLKDIWPRATLGIYCEFYYSPKGTDIGFDPEFPVKDPGDACRLHLKNLNYLLHFETADAGIAPTLWQARTFPEPFRSRITVVHDGIDTTRLIPGPNVRLTLNNHITLTRKDKIVTFVNRNLEPYRGYHIFMRALPEILKRNPDVRILVIGGNEIGYGSPPPYGSTWKEIFLNEVKDKLDLSRIFFLGRIPYRNFIAIMQLSTVHVYLTYPFVLSWSLLEAMSMGCAVVAGDTGPLHGVIEHDQTGRLVDFFNVEGVADNVTDLLTRPDECEKLGKNAREFIIKNYDLRNICLPRQLEWVDQLFKV